MKGLREILGTAFLTCTLQAASVVVGLPPVTGTGNCDPFGCPTFFGLGTYQQVFASSAFSGPIDIAQLTFADSQVSNNGLPAQGTYTLSFAYTSKAPGALDLNNPNNNITSGSQVFYSGPLPPMTTQGGRGLVFYGTTFPYDPASGNLLLTIVVSNPVDPPVHLYLDQAASTAATTNAYFGTLNGAPISGGNDVGGLITGFASLPLAFIGPAPLPLAVVGASYGPVTLLATGGTGGFTWSVTGLPSGLSASQDGILSGTPATGTPGTYLLDVTVTDSSSTSVSATLMLNVDASLVITGPRSLPAATVGTSYGPMTFTAVGGSGGYAWSAAGLPAGLSFSPAGVLSGTPVTGSQGAYNPQFSVTDSARNTVHLTLPLVVNVAALQITGPGSLAAGTVGVDYGHVMFTATGGAGSYVWSATGLPAGLTLTTGGVLAGTPAPASQGNYNPQFMVTDSSHNTASVTLPLLINPPPLQITGPSSLPLGAVADVYAPVTFQATGGTGGYTWTATDLPNGLSFTAGGVLSGTPGLLSTGTYNPQFTVTDSSQNTATVTETLMINVALLITGPLLPPAGQAGVPYGPVTFNAMGGTLGYTWYATGLPAGLTLSTAGVLSGTPAQGSWGLYLPTFVVTDSSHGHSSLPIPLVIAPKRGTQ
jgi:Putative Ig domain